MLPLWHESSCHETLSDARGVRCGFLAGPLGDLITPCVKGMECSPKGNTIHCITPMVLSAMHLQADPGKRALDGRQVGLALGFIEKREKWR